MRICVIGNSHVAALKTGFEGLSSEARKGAKVDFFAARGNALKGLQLVGESLKSDSPQLKRSLTFTSGGSEAILIKNYDIFLLHGLELQPFFAPDRFYSQAVLTAALDEKYSETITVSLVKKIRRITNVPVYVGHTPLPASDGGKGLEGGPAGVSNYERGIILSNELFFKKIAAALVMQPVITIAENGTNTLNEFSIGSRRLDVGLPDHELGTLHDRVDSLHMNDRFGSVWMQCFLADLPTD